MRVTSSEEMPDESREIHQRDMNGEIDQVPNEREVNEINEFYFWWECILSLSLSLIAFAWSPNTVLLSINDFSCLSHAKSSAVTTNLSLSRLFIRMPPSSSFAIFDLPVSHQDVEILHLYLRFSRLTLSLTLWLSLSCCHEYTYQEHDEM